jgi:hypothetical protein
MTVNKETDRGGQEGIHETMEGDPWIGGVETRQKSEQSPWKLHAFPSRPVLTSVLSPPVAHWVILCTYDSRLLVSLKSARLLIQPKAHTELNHCTHSRVSLRERYSLQCSLATIALINYNCTHQHLRFAHFTMTPSPGLRSSLLLCLLLLPRM